VLKGEHPSDSFINGMRYLDASASLAVGFPYEFLFSGAQSGGAPFRGAFEAAGREIMRLRNDVHRPRLDVISYVTIMDGVERRKLPPMPNIARGCWGFTTLPTADAFRDDASDIKAIRSGITTKSAVIMANSGRSFPVVLRESMQEAVATAMAVEDANRALVKAGYKPSVTIADIAQVSDNPQQAAAAENLTQGKPAEGSPQSKQTAAMSAFVGDVKIVNLPAGVGEEIAKHIHNGEDGISDLIVTRYGMTVPELIGKADPHNLETARKNVRYCTGINCADEVHGNGEKMILLMNDGIIDGHHFLAKAEKGKVTKSLPVIDLTPTRFQIHPAK
jgi:hypothetical protein